MAEGPTNYLSCSGSGHFVNLLLDYTSGVHFWGTLLGCIAGLNLAANLRPVLGLTLSGDNFPTSRFRIWRASVSKLQSDLRRLPSIVRGLQLQEGHRRR